MSQPYVGEIRIFAGDYAPLGWALCQGQLLPISEYETLFNLIGTIYGGDGQETFALPDLSGRIPVHPGTAGGLTVALGQKGGVESVTLTVNQIPAHTHAVNIAPSGKTSSPSGLLGTTATGSQLFLAPPGTVVGAAAQSVLAAGGSLPHSNMMPTQSINFIISLFGVFPSQ